VERTGFGPALFHDWRYQADGSVNPSFELNHPRAAGATILLAGANFGCGSSREHAPWALGEYGFRAILSESFADIFHANCCQNGILPVRLAAPEMAELFRRCDAAKEPYRLTVNLETCEVTDATGFLARFSIDNYLRESLRLGLDGIARSLMFESDIAAYERRRASLLARLEG
jgi:3-isopropylmalate/(R)-2-methylmalate dehydratase small subunit